MNKIDPKRSATFIAVFSGIALLLEEGIPRLDFRSSQSYSAPPVAQRHEIEASSKVVIESNIAAMERARYLDRYLNSDQKLGSKMLIVVAVSEDGKLDRGVSAALTKRFRNDFPEISSGFFKPEFFSDGLFDQMFDNPEVIVKKLDLANRAYAVLLAREKVDYTTDPSLENVISAHLNLEIMAFRVGDNGQSDSWNFGVNGAGFKEKDARSLAAERLIKQILNDTKMSLVH